MAKLNPKLNSRTWHVFSLRRGLIRELVWKGFPEIKLDVGKCLHQTALNPCVSDRTLETA